MAKTKKPDQALNRTFKVLKPHLKGHGLVATGGVIALLFDVVFRILEPWPMKFVIDGLSRSLGASHINGPAASWTLLLGAAGATVGIAALRALANYLSTVAFALTGSRIATSLRERAFRHVSRLSKRFHSSGRSGDLVQRLVADVGRLQEVAVTAGLPLLANIITLFAMLVVMLWLDWFLALVVVVTGAIFVVSSRESTDKITTASRKTRKSEGEIANIAQETIGAIQLVQAYGLEDKIAERFSGSSKKTLKDGVQSKRLAAGLERRTDVLIGVAAAVVLLFAGWEVMNHKMTPGDIIIFSTYLKAAMRPLRQMAKHTGRISRAAASGERVANILDIEPEVQTVSRPQMLRRIDGAIQFSHVTVRFNDKYHALRDVNVSIEPGQRVAFVGHSGSGKSTLSSLVPRLIDPCEGSISIDGVDIRNMDVEHLRSSITLIQQEAVLFTGDVMNNIRAGRLDATAVEVIEAAKLARAHDFIMAMPNGYRSSVGERGGTLSGGQRQRLSIARGILRNASIIILDEVTTGLDEANAEAVLEALDELTKGKTTIVVTHDTKTAEECDWVVWLEAGQVLWQGPSEQYGDARLERGFKEDE